MTPIPDHETSVRAIIPQQDKGDLVLCGLPGLRISHDGSAYFDPEHASATFEYLASLQVSLVYLFMEGFEVPKMAKQMIEAEAVSHEMKVAWIPIVDYGIPGSDSEELWKAGRAERSKCLSGGNSIAVTCLYGAGRCGMMAAAISAEMGIEVRKSVRYVRKHFVEAVGSLEQERWVAKGSYLT